MGVNNWQRIEELFHDASQLQGAARAAFLTSRCNGDDGILREVTSLLEASDRGTEFLEQPTFDLGIRVLSQTGALEGRIIGHYQIARLLGEGGMGEVYLAEDTKLERYVALKFLVSGLFEDQPGKDQLMREARAVAKLEHPHICPVYGLESIGEYDFIVMPYVDGETLASMLRKEAPTLDRVLEMSEQIASALAAAHSRGIIHRDVKPQNVLITEEGQAKILDFGLAKFVPRTQNPTTFDNGSTASQVGLIPGTVAYMSPEQIRGDKLDCATDIFSFGIVLHEMLNGRNPFLRETREQTLKAIANEELLPLPENVPPALTEITQKCLQKEAASRYAVGDELLTDLRRLRADRARQLASAWRPVTKMFFIAAIVLMVTALIAGGSIWRSATRVHTLAMLPITNESGDPSNNYMSVGLTRSLFDRFAGLPKLTVMLTTAAPATPNDPANQAGRDLQVESVLSGYLIKQADKLQLHLKLTRTADGKTSWEQSFDIQSVDLFALQDSIATGVTSSVGLWMIGNEKQALVRRPTDNQEAMKAYIRGVSAWNSRRGRDEISTAIGFFDQAIALDPSFAEAYAARAECRILSSPNVLYGSTDATEAISKATFDARKAIEINPLLAAAHTSIANIDLRYNWDWIEAEREFKLAIDLDPNYAPAHFFYANLLSIMQRFDEAIAESAKGRSLDPYSSISAVNYGRALYYARRFDDERQVLQQELEQNPGCGPCLHSMGWVLVQQGKIKEGITFLEKRYADDKLHVAAALGYAYARDGRADEARKMFAVLDQSPYPVPSHERALIYLGLRDFDQAFTYFQKSCDERFASIPLMSIDPLYDELRSDPRFVAIMNRANIRN
jgi:serine/threonine protein kinase/tetratricopeptide (TPR) repeat protein